MTEHNREASDEEGPLSREQQDAQLEAAKRAAAAGRPLEMLKYLYESKALDGLVRRLRSKWQKLGASDIDMAVAKSVDAAYAALNKGKTITSLIGFLWKAADRRAFDYNRLLHEQIPTDPALIDTVADPNVTAPGVDLSDDSADEERDAMIKRAAQVARKLLPRLGDTMRRVMSVVIDAAEEGIEDLPNSEIAAALNLSLDAVKQSKSRGFVRLDRLAKEEGLVSALPITTIASNEPEESEGT
jgi:DNA-directed RNA polymerase specialized sigma24 family protein